MPRAENIELRIDGEACDSFSEYQIDSDLLTPADAFSVTFQRTGGQAGERAWRRLLEIATPNNDVEITVRTTASASTAERQPLLTGIVDKAIVSVSRDTGTVLTLHGRDRAAHLCDSAAPVGLLRSLGGEDATFIQLARMACAPWGIEVITHLEDHTVTGGFPMSAVRADRRRRAEARRQGMMISTVRPDNVRAAARMGVPVDELTQQDPTRIADGSDSPAARARARGRARSASGMTPSDIERLTIDEASPQPGESVWTYLARHAERFGVLMFMDARGRLVLGAPDYNGDALYTLISADEFDRDQGATNVLEAHVEADGSRRYSRVSVIGRAHGQGTARTRIKAVAEDPDMPFPRERIEHDRSVRTQAQADRMAKRLSREGAADAEVIAVIAPGQGQSGTSFCVNTIANVVIPAKGINDRRYVTSCRFSRSREHGTQTELRLIRPGSLTL